MLAQIVREINASAPVPRLIVWPSLHSWMELVPAVERAALDLPASVLVFDEWCKQGREDLPEYVELDQWRVPSERIQGHLDFAQPAAAPDASNSQPKTHNPKPLAAFTHTWFLIALAVVFFAIIAAAFIASSTSSALSAPTHQRPRILTWHAQFERSARAWVRARGSTTTADAPARTQTQEHLLLTTEDRPANTPNSTPSQLSRIHPQKPTKTLHVIPCQQRVYNHPETCGKTPLSADVKRPSRVPL